MLRLVKGYGWLLKKVVTMNYLQLGYNQFDCPASICASFTCLQIPVTGVFLSFCGEFWQFVVPTDSIFFTYFLEAALHLSCSAVQVKVG